jgi:hypothetical protein
MCHVSAPAAPHLATSDTNSAILNAEAQHWHKQYSSNKQPLHGLLTIVSLVVNQSMCTDTIK